MSTNGGLWDNDHEISALGYGLLLGFVGAGLSSFGLSVWASIAYTRRNAEWLLGPEGDEVMALVLAKEVFPKPDVIKSDQPMQMQVPMHAITRSFYLVSYVFDAVRADGMTVRVQVRQRKVPSFVWNTLKEGEFVPVRFLRQEPRRCRIRAAAEHERRGALAMRARACLALFLLAAGTAAAVAAVVDGHGVGALVWVVVVALSVSWQLAGRRALQVVCPCFRQALQAPWSPLFTHRGFVIAKDLGKDVEPCQTPEPVIPEDVQVAMDLPLLHA